jgi:chorismate mutase
MNIDDWRKEIDEVDKEILKLINKRARLGLEVGVLKAKAGLPIYDREREQAVLENLCAENEGPLSCDAIIRIFRRIIQETRTVEANSITNIQTQAREIV